MMVFYFICDQYDIIYNIRGFMKTNEIKKYLKKEDPALYSTFGKLLYEPVLLANQLIRHYQWIYLRGDIDNLLLDDRFNKNYLNLFIYALESSKEFADKFISYFVYSLQLAFNNKTKKWDMQIISDILINRKRAYKFDLIAMYALMASTYDRIIDIVEEVEPNVILKTSKKDILDLFNKIIDQNFYENLKREIKHNR